MHCIFLLDCSINDGFPSSRSPSFVIFQILDYISDPATVGKTATMTLLNALLTPWIGLFIPLYTALYYIIPYFTTYSSLAKIPGPFGAKFSNIWLGLSARRGQKYAAVDWALRKYGRIVRVGYNHVSIANERALQAVYGHGNGFLKE
jgi:benzoate 4-monooxygenase